MTPTSPRITWQSPTKTAFESGLKSTGAPETRWYSLVFIASQPGSGAFFPSLETVEADVSITSAIELAVF
jgi:hypothetical protein